jgi:hypothetical protein
VKASLAAFLHVGVLVNGSPSTLGYPSLSHPTTSQQFLIGADFEFTGLRSTAYCMGSGRGIQTKAAASGHIVPVRERGARLGRSIVPRKATGAALRRLSKAAVRHRRPTNCRRQATGPRDAGGQASWPPACRGHCARTISLTRVAVGDWVPTSSVTPGRPDVQTRSGLSARMSLLTVTELRET